MSTIENPSENSPHILVLGMGGTIAGLASNPADKPLQYEAGQVEVASLLAHIRSAIPEGISLVSKQVANINSRNLTESLLTLLGEAVREALANSFVQGVVVTHGTDTIEETVSRCARTRCRQQECVYETRRRHLVAGFRRRSQNSHLDCPSVHPLQR